MVEVKVLDKTNFCNYVSRINNLYEMYYSAVSNTEVFKWRFLMNPLNDVTAVIAIQEDNVIGFIGSMPHTIVEKNRKIKSALIVNIIVHQSYRGLGIFSKMLNKLEKTLETKGYEFLYSFPNNSSNNILVSKHSWSTIYEIPRLEFYGKYKDTSIGDLKTFEREEKNLIQVEKGVTYYDWRIKENPIYKYEVYETSENDIITSKIILRHYKNEVNIVATNYSKIESFILNVKKILAEYGETKTITAWSSLNDRTHVIYERIGFKNSEPIVYFSGKILRDINRNKKLLCYYDWKIDSIDNNIY